MISQEEKKKLKQQYAQMRPPMGAYQIKCNTTGKCYVGATRNLDNVMNGLSFQLKMGTARINALQQDWNLYGEENMVFSVLEQLEYDKDESKIDYTDDLQTLRALWIEQLNEQQIEIEELKRL